MSDSNPHHSSGREIIDGHDDDDWIEHYLYSVTAVVFIGCIGVLVAALIIR